MPSAVLVAEPEPETREYLGRQLRDDGFDVLGAARRSEALELAESARSWRPRYSRVSGSGSATRTALGMEPTLARAAWAYQVSFAADR